MKSNIVWNGKALAVEKRLRLEQINQLRSQFQDVAPPPPRQPLSLLEKVMIGVIAATFAAAAAYFTLPKVREDVDRIMSNNPVMKVIKFEARTY